MQQFLLGALRLLLLVVILSFESCITSQQTATIISNCEILIVGGSLSSLAAAITIANTTAVHNPLLQTCLLEPTDWPGGQLTSSSVPPDMEYYTSSYENFPRSFVQLLNQITNSSWISNPGMCWVSTKCFESSAAAKIIDQWIQNFIPSLRIYYQTVVIASARHDSIHNLDSSYNNGDISSVTAIRRTAKVPYTGWDNNLSKDLLDWYSVETSLIFKKELIEFSNFNVVIEGSELGDLIMSSGVEVNQGIEFPFEHSETVNSACGQSAVFPFHMSYGKDYFDENEVPSGDIQEGDVMSVGDLSWMQSWTYRRVVSENVSSDADVLNEPTIAKGEQANQNWGNDYTAGYIFLSFDELNNQGQYDRNINSNTDSNTSNKSKSIVKWAGGINMSTLEGMEQRAYAYFHYVRGSCDDVRYCDNKKPPMDIQPYLGLNKTQVGTGHGLSKLPYIRDSRRSALGIESFKLMYSDLNFPNPADNGTTARYFHDTVGIGSYMYADIHHLADTACPPNYGYPPYLTGENNPIRPYYIPFRALTVQSAGNLLVCGKAMAQSFLANAGTRLHPSEWSSGVAAGAAALLMVRNQWNSTQHVYNHIEELQKFLESGEVNSPLEWTL